MHVKLCYDSVIIVLSLCYNIVTCRVGVIITPTQTQTQTLPLTLALTISLTLTLTRTLTLTLILIRVKSCYDSVIVMFPASYTCILCVVIMLSVCFLSLVIINPMYIITQTPVHFTVKK
jgi:hypothetical protein